MTARPPCPDCPHRAWLENATQCSRALRTENRAWHTTNDRLRERLARFEHIGIRRYREAEAWNTRVGREVWCENVMLRHALQPRAATMPHHASVISTLTAVLRAGDAHRERQEGA